MNELRLSDPFAIEPMEDVFRGLMRPWRSSLAEQAPQIRLEVHEDDKNYVVKAEIPGVKREDIEVRIEGNRVSIAAEIKKEKDEKKQGRLLRSERQYGYASRSFVLDADVDEARSQARYKDGVLELTLPKTGKPTSRRLAID